MSPSETPTNPKPPVPPVLIERELDPHSKTFKKDLIAFSRDAAAELKRFQIMTYVVGKKGKDGKLVIAIFPASSKAELRKGDELSDAPEEALSELAEKALSEDAVYETVKRAIAPKALPGKNNLVLGLGPPPSGGIGLGRKKRR